MQFFMNRQKKNKLVLFFIPHFSYYDNNDDNSVTFLLCGIKPIELIQKVFNLNVLAAVLEAAVYFLKTSEAKHAVNVDNS